MLQREQFLSSITGTHQHQHHHIHQHQELHNNNQGPIQAQRPLQQSSPSDQSVSTGTPPHQISRASPASTALVMSSNNIASSSRQLTPNSGGSSGSGGSGSGGIGHSNALLNPHDSADNTNTQDGQEPPPNPMMRQFPTCHSKSMSVGADVSVPGMTNNLATATGMQQNNMINTTIAASQQHHHHQMNNQQQQQQNQQHQHQHHQQQQQMQDQHHLQHQHQQLMQVQQQRQQHHTLHHASNSGASQQQQVSATSKRQPHQRRSNHHHHHHRSVSSQQQQHQQHQQQVISQHQHQQVLSYQQHQTIAGSSQDFLDGGGVGGGSSSIILSNANINNIHNRSASTHLSSLILAGPGPGHNHPHINQHHEQHHHHRQHNHFAPPQASQRTHLAAGVAANHDEHQIKANSIWSIDENLSKSHGKLTASGYLHPAHSYLLGNPSITDISCDNLSTASRLMGGSGAIGMGPNGELGGPAPGYYSHHHQHQHHQAPATHNGGGGGGGGGGAMTTTSQGAIANGMGGAQTTGGPPGHHNSQALSLATSRASLRQARFLPICDLMFNLISMILYFCENVFGIIALIALYYHATSRYWALVGAAFVFGSNLMCQYLSLRWLFKMKLDECRRKREAQEELENEEECERRYYNRMSAHMRNYQCGSCTWLPDGATEVQLKFLLSIAMDAVFHILCLGFLARYIKLVIPVSDSSRVKREASDLCMLRMIHGFVQSAPLLLLQSFMVCSQNYANSIANLSIISVILSLISACWALASFTKYARNKYMHKFVLTWLGILSQLLWRLGTISSRVAALTIYAVYYNYWMLVVLALHWVTMFLWLVKPGNLLRDETNMSRSKKISLAIGASWIYCFCFMNFEEHNSRTKMGIFYLIMFVENNLLFTVCQAFSAQVTWFKSLVILVVYLGFVFGMLFMLLYYKYFHVSVLNSDLSCSQDSIDSIADQLSPAGKKIAGFKPGTLRLKSDDRLASAKFNSNISATLKSGSHPEIARTSSKPPYLSAAAPNQSHLQQSSVFNCKLNGDFKKPSLPGQHVRH